MYRSTIFFYEHISINLNSSIFMHPWLILNKNTKCVWAILILGKIVCWCKKVKKKIIGEFFFSVYSCECCEVGYGIYFKSETGLLTIFTGLLTIFTGLLAIFAGLLVIFTGLLAIFTNAKHSEIPTLIFLCFKFL